MSKTIIHAIVVGTIAAFAIFISGQLTLPAWSLFIGWVCYFIFAQSAKQGALCFLHLVIGLVLAALVIIVSNYLAIYLPSNSLLAVVFVLAASLTFVESAPHVNNIPAYYIGMIVMFASAQPPSFSVLLELSFAMSIGLCLGFLTVSIRSLIPKTSKL